MTETDTGADVTADVRLAIAKALYFGHRCCSGCFSCDYDEEWPENGIYSMGYDGGQWSEGMADDVLELIKPLVDAAVAEALAAERIAIARAITNVHGIIAVGSFTIDEATFQRMGPVVTTRDVERWILSRGVEAPKASAPVTA